MQNRPPFELWGNFVIYNLFQILLNSWIFISFYGKKKTKSLFIMFTITCACFWLYGSASGSFPAVKVLFYPPPALWWALAFICITWLQRFRQYLWWKKIPNHHSNVGVCIYWHTRITEWASIQSELFVECDFPSAISWYYAIQVTVSILPKNPIIKK